MNMRSDLFGDADVSFPPVKLNLPRLSGEAAQTRKRIAQLIISGTADFFDRDWTFEKSKYGIAGQRTATVVSCKIGGHDVSIAVEADIVARIMQAANVLQGFNDLKPHQRGLVTEHVLSDSLAALEERFDSKITVLSLRRDITYDLGDVQLCLTGTLADHAPFTFHIWAEDQPAFLHALESTFPAHGPRQIADLSIDAAVLGPISVMPRHQVAQLTVGSVLVPLQGWAGHDSAIYLRAGHDAITPLAYAEGGGMRVNGATNSFAALLEQFTTDKNMSASDTQAAHTPHDPNVVVTVELSRMDLLISQLQLIQEGDVLDFEMMKVETITICANGKPFAEGKLVELDDTVGVHIEKLL